MTIGLILGYLWNLSFLKNFILVFTFIMIYPMMINLKFKKVFEGGDTKMLFTAQLINFLIIPFLAYGIGRLFWRELLSYFGNAYGRPCSYQWDDYFLDWFCQG
ncbi:MAG: hypothetical protein ACP5HI_08415 [Caldimicrobium sp.]